MPQKIHFADGRLQNEIARAREIVAMCIEVLQQSRRDTFLGRQRHEPNPMSDGHGEVIIDPQTEQPDLPPRDTD
jgi:hypothetical protein